MVVKEFLQKEFEGKSNLIRPLVMGPTPFHADFIISYKTKESNEEEEVTLKKEVKRGYDTFKLTLNIDEGYDYKTLKNSVYFTIAREFGLYYEIKQIINRRKRNWMKIEEAVDLLFQNSNMKIWNIKRKLFQVPSILTDLYQKIAKFERDEIFFKQEYERYLNKAFVNSETSFFKEEVEEMYRTEMSNLPIEQVIRYVNTFEQRRLNLNDASSAIIGGIVGALLTILFAR